MKTLVLFYSYSGNTRKLAKVYAEREHADILEVKSIEKPGRLKVYTAGCFAAITGKGWPIRPLSPDWTLYDRVVIYAPVWADNPAPYIYTALKLLPSGKSVEFRMVSASGSSRCRASLESIVRKHDCTLTEFKDIKA